jgi:HSF-type DNA-binding
MVSHARLDTNGGDRLKETVFSLRVCSMVFAEVRIFMFVRFQLLLLCRVLFNPNELSASRLLSPNDALGNRTEDGEMFVIKDPETFATQVIPQYFDHNKFSSFARQVRHGCVAIRHL